MPYAWSPRDEKEVFPFWEQSLLLPIQVAEPFPPAQETASDAMFRTCTPIGTVDDTINPWSE